LKLNSDQFVKFNKCYRINSVVACDELDRERKMNATYTENICIADRQISA